MSSLSQRGALLRRPEPRSSPRSAPKLNKIRAVVILGGSVRPSPLAQATGRAIVDLPATQRESLLGSWQREVAAIVDRDLHDGEPLKTHVVLNRHAREPKLPPRDSRVDLRLVNDLREFRGSGGLLRDLTEDFDDASYVLIAHGAQILLDPLANLAETLVCAKADVSLVAHADGTPGGLMLIRSGCLDHIPEIGYCDLKEQALPEIAKHHRVRVVRRDSASGIPIRTPVDYLKALEKAHRARRLEDSSSSERFDGRLSGLWERGRPSFAIVEDGARVDPGGRVHDAVVLRGGRVKAGAFVARSIVCGSGMVRRRHTVVNRLISTVV